MYISPGAASTWWGQNCFLNDVNVNPIQDGGDKKAPLPTSFSPVISTNVWISP